MVLGCCRTWEIEANGLRARDAGKWGVRRCATIGEDRVVREGSDAAASGDEIMGRDSVTAAEDTVNSLSVFVRCGVG